MCVPSFIRETRNNAYRYILILGIVWEEEIWSDRFFTRSGEDEFVLEIFFPAYPNTGGSDRPVARLPGLVPSQLDSS